MLGDADMVGTIITYPVKRFTPEPQYLKLSSFDYKQRRLKISKGSWLFPCHCSVELWGILYSQLALMVVNVQHGKY